MCISAEITCVESCKVSLEVKKEQEYLSTHDMDQNQKFILELKDEMTRSHGDKQRKTLAYLDSSVVDRHGKKSVMTQEVAILFQEGDKPMKELVVTNLANEDKGIFSNLRKYDEVLNMLEYWLFNPRIDTNESLMFDESIGK